MDLSRGVERAAEHVLSAESAAIRSIAIHLTVRESKLSDRGVSAAHSSIHVAGGQ